MANFKETFKNSLQRAIQRIKPGTIFINKDSDGSIRVDLGEVPWHGQAVLIFPEGTHIGRGGQWTFTGEGEEILVKSWSSCMDMTIGYLIKDEEYFKALNSPEEVRELKNVKKGKPE
jgi:1-acyl-sn-glycerol-3-phosphate acyltransferase